LIVTDEGVKKRPPLPTMTVTVTAFAIVGWKARSEAIITTNSARRRSEVLIASVTSCNANNLLPAGNTGKVTGLLLLGTVEAHDRCALFCIAEPSVGDLPLFETTGRIYDDPQSV